jgi:hypothetical protein
MCVELESKLGAPDWLMVRVHARRNWYLLPDNSYESLEAYIDATRAALVTDVRAYQAEVSAAEAAQSKRRREARAGARPQCRSAPSRRARPSGRSAACNVILGAHHILVSIM